MSDASAAEPRSGAALRTAAILVVMCAAACSGADAGTVATTTPAVPPPAATTTSTAPAVTAAAATTTTTTPAVPVALELHDAERRALRLGVTLAVSIDGEQVGRLSDTSRTVTVDVTGPTAVDFSYVGLDGVPADVTWRQRIAPGDPAVVVVQPWRDLGGLPTDMPTDIVLAWQRRMSPGDALDEIDGTPVNVVSPLWWHIDDEAVLTGGADPAYVEAMHERGIAVWPAVQGLHADGLHLLLNNDELRGEVVAELSGASAASGADGFNIDLEGFRNEDAAAFSVFVEELAAAVHAWGGVVTYDLVPRSDTWDVTPPELAFWSTAPQRRRLAAAVDYTVLMAYDQHNRHRPAGPVAAPGWVEEMIVHQLRYSDAHTIILGLPAYGRLWDPAELDAPRALGFGAFRDLDGERSFDAVFAMDRIELEDGRFYWADHEATVSRVTLGSDYGLSGYAVWRLGLDDAELWTDIRLVPQSGSG